MQKTPSIFTFKELQIEDSYQLLHWLQLEHIKAFWDDGDRTLEQVQQHYFKDENTKRYLFFLENVAVGYMQSYCIDATHEYASFVLPNQISIGIDFFIGDQNYLNKGLSLQVVQQFILDYCRDVDCIIVDPEPINHKAIYLYKKYGFFKIGDYHLPDKSLDIMAIDLKKITNNPFPQ